MPDQDEGGFRLAVQCWECGEAQIFEVTWRDIRMGRTFRCACGCEYGSLGEHLGRVDEREAPAGEVVNQ